MTDDLGTAYPPSGGGGGDDQQHVSFRGAPPAAAQWLEIALEGRADATFRIAL